MVIQPGQQVSLWTHQRARVLGVYPEFHQARVRLPDGREEWAPLSAVEVVEEHSARSAPNHHGKGDDL